MFAYSAYGLIIQSELWLPELPPASGEASIIVRLEDLSAAPDESKGRSVFLRIEPTESLLAVSTVGVFRMRQGREITVYPAPGVEAALLRRHLLGNVLAILLHQKGHLILHASVLKLGDRGIAFLGESGAGKSSTAAALHARGYPIIADDAAVLDRSNGIVRVLPGVPHLRLSQQAADSLGLGVECLAHHDAAEDKRAYRVPDSFATEAAELDRAYILRRGNEPRIEALTTHQAVVEFIRHSIPTRFVQPGDAHHFRQCLDLAGRLPVFGLTVPADIDGLPELARRVEEHCLADTATQEALPRDG